MEDAQGGGRRLQLIGVYRLPGAVLFEASCSGVAVDTYIGDYDARITLPLLEAHNVRPPDIGVPASVFDDMFDERPDPSPFQTPRWGTVGAPSRGTPGFLVTDIAIAYERLNVHEVEIEHTSRGLQLIQDHFVMDFFAQIDPFMDRVASWLSVLSRQPIDVAGRLKMSITEGEGLVLVARRDTDFTRASHIEWSAPIHRDVEPATESVWRDAIALAADRALPPVLHELLAQARVALELKDYRLAVIQAATAVEVSLAQLVEADLDALGSPLASALGNERRTIGMLIRLIGPAYSLPSGTQRFVHLRNQAIHKNYNPSADEAAESLEIASQITATTSPPATAGFLVRGVSVPGPDDHQA